MAREKELTSSTIAIQGDNGKNDGEHVADVVKASKELAEILVKAGILE